MPRKILINTNNSIGTFITKVNTLSDYFGDMDDLSLKFDSLDRDSNLVSAINLLDSQIGNMALLDSIGFQDSDRVDLVAALNSISSTIYGGKRDLIAATVHAGLDSAGELDIFREPGGKFEKGGFHQNGSPNVDSVSYIENLYVDNLYADSMQVGQYITLSFDSATGESKIESRAPTDKLKVGAVGGTLELYGDSGVNLYAGSNSNGANVAVSLDSSGMTVHKKMSNPYPSFIGNVQDIVDSGFVNQGEFINTVFHSGNGVVTVPDSGFAKGSLITIRTIGTMTIYWGESSEGISLGNATKLASGIWDSSNWYFSETVV